jgi:hypothetical protein
MLPEPVRRVGSALSVALVMVKKFEIAQSIPIRTVQSTHLRTVKTATVRALENEGIEFHQDRKRAYVGLD